MKLVVVSLSLPALRERRQDIPLLARHFLDRLNRRADLLAPLWLALLGVVLLGSWHAAGRA